MGSGPSYPAGDKAGSDISVASASRLLCCLGFRLQGVGFKESGVSSSKECWGLKLGGELMACRIMLSSVQSKRLPASRESALDTRVFEFKLPQTIPGLFCVEHTHVLGRRWEFANIAESVCRKVQAESYAEKSTLGALCMQKILPELLAPHGSLAEC